MLIIENQEYFDKVREFARSVGADAASIATLHLTASSGGLNTARSKAGNPGLSAA
jgi:hypothetical protein